ncbi:MAG TPA: heavy metal-binding domain-containing protein [Blastocatellia bacterium]|nr:heavy metal-binding domain-containing protein [Blastocatellia bacterium]
MSLCVPAVSFSPRLASAQEQATFVCPMHPEVTASKQGDCPKCGMKLVAKSDKKSEEAAVQREAAAPESGSEESFTCPMHLEVRSPVQGKCSLCGMALVPAVPALGDDFEIRVVSTPKAPRPNEKVSLRFSIYNPKTREQVKKFALLHEELLHLFIVSQDMNEFQHIHPRLEADGSFSIDTRLPQPGRYKLYMDFYPAEGIPQVLQANLSTAGYSNDILAGTARLKPDAVFEKVVNGIKIVLKLDPTEIIAGRPATLRYELTDARTGEPVRDLLPYLGAWGHTLILSEDQTDYVHSHPVELVPEQENRSALRGGPVVTFEAMLPRPGAYRVWTQFLRGQTLSTVSFTIAAEQLK